LSTTIEAIFSSRESRLRRLVPRQTNGGAPSAAIFSFRSFQQFVPQQADDRRCSDRRAEQNRPAIVEAGVITMQRGDLRGMKTRALNFSGLLTICLFLLLALEARGASRENKREFFAKLMEGEIETLAEFDELAAKAKAAGATEQSVFEAKLMFCLKNEDLGPIPTLLPQLETTLPDWKESDSPFFRDRDELEGLLHLAKGLVAARDQASDVFEREMKEAIWKDPKLAEIVAEHIIAFREKQRMKAIAVPMHLELETSQGGKTSLAKLVEGKKALLLDFWASWCSPCMAAMGDLRSRAEKLKPAGIVVAGINTESDRAKAEKVRKDKKMPMPWVLEPREGPLSKLLRIDSIPRAVLVTPDGKIAFSGHPEDRELETALSKVGGISVAR
jgi:thiol-disulfide isomerase/thioredoxin